MSTAFADPVAGHAAHVPDDVALAVARLNAFAGGRETAETRARWQVDEEEILRASITVILIALTTVIAVAVIAILTMG